MNFPKNESLAGGNAKLHFRRIMSEMERMVYLNTMRSNRFSVLAFSPEFLLLIGNRLFEFIELVIAADKDESS